MAVIDGQQRMTALYIGLRGTYAYRMPRKWLKDNEENLPTRSLYLIFNNNVAADDERNMTYNFKFLSDKDLKSFTNEVDLFKVGNIYKYQDADDLEEAIAKYPRNARRTLRRLRQVVFSDQLINYYQEEVQDLDSVLDIFIRTNSGGEPLSFSNLLMSFTTATWGKDENDSKDARKLFDELIKEVANEDFFISSDFILKSCLVLFCDNIKFRIQNFDKDTVRKFGENWERVHSCIINTFLLLKKWGFNDSTLRAKNAVIPLVQYLFVNNIGGEILKDHKHNEEKKAMRKWLSISLMKGVFGGQSDRVLLTIKKVLDENAGIKTFPFEQIKEVFSGDDAKSLTLSEGVIDSILETQYNSPNSYAILTLLYSHLDFDGGIKYHQDHLHPASKFRKLKEKDFSSLEDFKFFTDKKNWNSILNLQLLSGSTNESKNDKGLDEWMNLDERGAEKHVFLKDHLIPENVSLKFEDFKAFIQARRELLKTTIMNII